LNFLVNYLILFEDFDGSIWDTNKGDLTSFVILIQIYSKSKYVKVVVFKNMELRFSWSYWIDLFFYFGCYYFHRGYLQLNVWKHGCQRFIWALSWCHMGFWHHALTLIFGSQIPPFYYNMSHQFVNSIASLKYDLKCCVFF